MYDSDIFGIEDPVTREAHTCCIMGRNREHFALAVYLGVEGFAGYAAIAAGTYGPTTPGAPPNLDFLVAQRCLMASFEDRDFLRAEDRTVIAQIGLRFRGRNAWPCFRDHTPPYFPWFLTAAHAELLTTAIAQAMDVAVRFRDDQTLLDPPDGDDQQILVRVRARSGAAWSDAWRPFPIPDPAAWIPPIFTARAPVDAERCARVRSSARSTAETWEVDCFPLPEAVQDNRGMRPYFPYTCMVVDRSSGLIVHHEILPIGRMHGDAVRAEVCAAIERLRCIPETIAVRRDMLAALLAPLAVHLGNRIACEPKLPALTAAQRELTAFFTERRR